MSDTLSMHETGLAVVAQMALDWIDMKIIEKKPFVASGATVMREIDTPKRFALRVGDVDWSDRNDPVPDASTLLRTGSPRCLCNNGCGHVFASESTFDRHLLLTDGGGARCRTPRELRVLKRPMFRDVVGVWHSGSKAVTE